MNWHVIPVKDKEFHYAHKDCWCFPVKVEDNLYVHNAKDTRETYERRTGKVVDPSKNWDTILEKTEN